MIFFFYLDEEAFGSLRGSEKGVINFAAALGLGEVTDQVLKNPRRKGGEQLYCFF